MRKIALIMDGWKYSFTYAWPSGILQRIHETNEDINLYIFNSFGNWSRDKLYNQGEYNLYNLPDFADFDGIILDLNNISSHKVLAEVTHRAKKSGKPVVSLANELENFYYAGIDNYTAMQKVIEHLHKEHGCKKFWFIMGPTENYESGRRTKALKDYMKANKLSISEKDILHKGFDCRSGVEGFQELLATHTELPDAVICVNDNVAVGVCETAAAKGYQIPKDFRVTGFDNFDKAGFYYPSITTVGHIREDAGYLAADILLRIWAGEEVPGFNYTDTALICQESCGCGQKTLENLREHLKGQVMYGIETTEFDSEVLSLESEMRQCSTVEEMMYCIPQCIPSLKCDAMYLVLDEHINAYKNETEEVKWSIQNADAGFCKEGYPEKMQVRFAYEKDKKLDLTHTEISNLFPTFDYAEGGKDFLFLPLHFGDYTVGFFAIRNAVYLMEKQYLFQVVNALTSAMENLHKKEQLEYMNRKLSKLYMMDPLTGLYNRMGYQKLGENYFNFMHAKQKRIIIFFIDLDKLKYINDTFGHEYGDYAICAAAKAITKNCSTDAIPARTGGDEFVLVQSYSSDEDARKQLRNMRKQLQEEGKRMNLPFALGISVGSVVTDPASDQTYSDYVKIADEKMYKDKLARRASRGE